MDDDAKNKSTHLQDNREEAADEDISLSGLILSSNEVEFQDRSKSSASDPSDFFEFFSNLNSENMPHAEDIIFCGKLMSYQQHPPRPQGSKSNHFLKQYPTRNEKQQSFHRRRSGSLNDLKTTPSNSAKDQPFMRSSRSLDYQKMYRCSASAANSRADKVEIKRSSSTKNSGKEKIVARPRWYMMFGLVKFPQEMAYQDIKNRQVRRNPGTLFTSLDAGGGGRKSIVSRGDDRRWLGSWNLLDMLSCKGHASVAVTASFGCLQHV